jgi:hypothetical protein
MTGELRRGEKATGTPNTIYDLSSVLFNALEESVSVDQYIRDAEEVGDHQLSEFFRRVRDEDSMRADEAQLLLAERTPTAARAEGMTPEASPTAESAGAPPRTEGVGASPTAESAREPARTEEDRGLLDRARDALTGQEQEPRREETGPRTAPRGSRGDEPLAR